MKPPQGHLTTEKKENMDEKLLHEIGKVSIEIVEKRKAVNAMERAARQARTALEMVENEHFLLVQKYAGTPP
jgi:hypothetical protein